MKALKLCVCIVHSRDKGRITDELVRAGFKFTVIGSTGGFLREGNTTMLVGVEDDDVETLKSVFQANCQTREQIVNVPAMELAPQSAFMASPIKVTVGGAVIFVINAEEFCRF